MKIIMFRQPSEILQLSSFVKQGATLLQFKPMNVINFIKLNNNTTYWLLHVLGLTCPLPRGTQLYKTVV